MRAPAILTVLVLLLGCYDWSPDARIGAGDDDDLLAGDDDDGGDDDDDATDDDDTVDPCTEEVGAEGLLLDVSCTIEAELETDPQLEVVWQYGVFETDPTYDQVMMTPIGV